MNLDNWPEETPDSFAIAFRDLPLFLTASLRASMSCSDMGYTSFAEYADRRRFVNPHNNTAIAG